VLFLEHLDQRDYEQAACRWEPEAPRRPGVGAGGRGRRGILQAQPMFCTRRDGG
jgi:hypothetical protein